MWKEMAEKIVDKVELAQRKETLTAWKVRLVVENRQKDPLTYL